MRTMFRRGSIRLGQGTRLAVAIGAGALLGCPSAAIRTADTLAPGQISGGLQLSMSFPDEDFVAGDTAPIDRVLGGIMMVGAIGLPGGCDLALGLGPATRLASAEGRCGILQQRNGAPLSLTPGVGVAFSPFSQSSVSPWELRGFVDVSSRLGPVSPLLRLEYAQGPWLKHVYRGDEPRHLERGAYLLEQRFARRLHITGGLALHLPVPDSDSGEVQVIVAATPYWILNADGPTTPVPPGIGGTVGVEQRF